MAWRQRAGSNRRPLQRGVLRKSDDCLDLLIRQWSTDYPFHLVGIQAEMVFQRMHPNSCGVFGFRPGWLSECHFSNSETDSSRIAAKAESMIFMN
jgi:hypothetical protein